MTAIWNQLTAADKASALIDLLGVILTALALGFAGFQFMRGVQQYQHEQRWRRKEYVAKEYDRLVADPKAGLILQMLDWDKRSLPLLADRDGKPIMVSVDRLMLGRALIPHRISGRPSWGPGEAAIRDCMDVLLERLGTFETMISEGLVKERDIKPYLSYWIELIGNPHSRSHPGAIRNLWLYIDIYKFRGAAAFIKRFGYSIRPNQTDVADLEGECERGEWGRSASASPPEPGQSAPPDRCPA